MASFQIREYNKTDTKKILNLFQRSFNKETSEASFRWKYEHSPWGAKAYVAIDRGRAVAFYGGVRLQFKSRGKKLWAYQICDVMTHPGYRGLFFSKTPIVVRLGKLFYSENSLDFAFGFPSIRHAKLQCLALGLEGYRFVTLFKRSGSRKFPSIKKLEVKEGWGCLVEADLRRLLARQNRYSFYLEKDEHYIRWRYREHPSRKYNVLMFAEKKKTKGIIICSLENDRVNILELLSFRNDDIDDILATFEAYIRENTAAVRNIVLWSHPMTSLNRCLDTLRYKAENHIPLGFKSVTTSSYITAKIFFDRYYYCMGDYDAA